MQLRAPDILRTEIAGTNINETTFLATDYLNHFNEVVMLLDIAQEMPECIDDARDWQPRSYVEHFRSSNFTARELAIEAYHAAPPEYRDPLEEVVAQLNRNIIDTLNIFESNCPKSCSEDCKELLAGKTAKLKAMIKLASAVINGTCEATNPADIDAILNRESTSGGLAQDEIDKLF